MRLQHVILCEGYDDRAFWTGWLQHLGCTSRGRGARDPWGRPVRGGEYAFDTPGGCFLRVVPVGGDSKLKSKVRFFLAAHATHPVGYLIVNWDRDDPPDTSEGTSDQDRLRDMLGEASEDGAWQRTPAGVRAGALVWHIPVDAGGPGVPEKNTLECLVAAAIARAYDERAASVESWLHDPAAPEGVGPKHYAYAYLAKWYAELGCEYFYEHVWSDDVVSSELEELLGAQYNKLVRELVDVKC